METEPTMIQANLKNILTAITSVTSNNNITYPVRLVAVSKTKSVEEIKEAYDAGIRHFGENYVEEIEEKQPKLPQDIKWHFIGHLQSNKIKKTLVPNLEYLETIDRQREELSNLSLADKIQKHLEKNEKDRKLNIFIQVKTSSEESKSGVNVAEAESLFMFVKEKCPNLVFRGLMTIGEEGDRQAFKTLKELAENLKKKYSIKNEDFELSMGMSGDFEAAIEEGSTNVRVGSSIFGARNYPNKQEKQ